MRYGLLLLLLNVAGCSHPPVPRVDPASTGSDVGVRIVNHGWSDVVILLSTGGSPERLGMAGAAKSTNFFIPWRRLAAAGAVRLAADPTDGTPGLVSERLLLQPGKLVVWTLEQPLDQSSIAVY